MKGKDYSFLKKKLSEILVEVVCPLGKKIKKLMNDRNYLEDILKEGTKNANKIAENNLKQIKNIVGLL